MLLLSLSIIIASAANLQAQHLTEYMPNDATFIGVWRTAKRSTPQLLLPGGPSLSGLRDQAARSGYKMLREIEISDRNVYYTVWGKEMRRTSRPSQTGSSGGQTARGSSEVYSRVVEGDWQAIQAALKPKPGTRPSGYLKNIEVYSKNGRPYYHATFFNGNPRKQELHKAANWNGFVSLWKKVSARNMRLASVEYFKGQFVGLFEAGSQGYYLFNFTGWDPFVKKWQELGKKDYRLVDMEVYRSNTGKWHYVGVWLPGKDGYYLWNVKGYHNFVKKFNQLKGKYELVDLEIIP